MKGLSLLLLALLLMPMSLAINVEISSTNPAPIKAGEYADVTFLFTKEATDGPMTSLEFSIEETDFIIPISESEVAINGLSFNNKVTKTFRIFFSDRLPEGFIDIQTNIIYGENVLERDLEVFVEEEDSNPELLVGSVRTVPTELLPDTDNNEITISLQNLGDKDAELVSAKLVTNNNLVKPAYAYSMIDSVSRIVSGEEEELLFVIDLEEELREAINAELRLRYRTQNDAGNSYDTFAETLPFIIPVAESPFLEVIDYEQKSSFATGSTENVIRVAIKNTGVEDAEEVRVRAIPDISVPFIFELTTEYVASEIEPNETAYVEFTMEVLDAQIREYPITVRLEALVGETRYSREDFFIVTPTQGTSISTSTIAFVLVAVAIIAAVVLGLRVRRK